MITSSSPVIAIDGPCGSGKGVISQLLAQEKGWHLLESGSIYRVLALSAKQKGIDPEDEDRLKQLADNLKAQFIITSQNNIDILLENQRVNDILHTPEIGSLASKISVLPGVRKALLNRQRAFREDPGLVAEGRDMGTVVFPEAEVKIFLTASLEARAERRYQQLLEKGFRVKLSDVIQEILERDARDQQRATSPLKMAEDAVMVDATHLTIDEVMHRVRKIVENKLGK